MAHKLEEVDSLICPQRNPAISTPSLSCSPYSNSVKLFIVTIPYLRSPNRLLGEVAWRLSTTGPQRRRDTGGLPYRYACTLGFLGKSVGGCAVPVPHDCAKLWGQTSLDQKNKIAQAGTGSCTIHARHYSCIGLQRHIDAEY